MANPHLRAAESRPKSDKEKLYQKIAQECGEAWLAAKNGKNHPRLSRKNIEQKRQDVLTLGYARGAAYMPELPTILVTTKHDNDFLDYLTPIYGPGNSIKQE